VTGGPPPRTPSGCTAALATVQGKRKKGVAGDSPAAQQPFFVQPGSDKKRGPGCIAKRQKNKPIQLKPSFPFGVKGHKGQAGSRGGTTAEGTKRGGSRSRRRRDQKGTRRKGTGSPNPSMTKGTKAIILLPTSRETSADPGKSPVDRLQVGDRSKQDTAVWG